MASDQRRSLAPVTIASATEVRVPDFRKLVNPNVTGTGNSQFKNTGALGRRKFLFPPCDSKANPPQVDWPALRG